MLIVLFAMFSSLSAPAADDGGCASALGNWSPELIRRLNNSYGDTKTFSSDFGTPAEALYWLFQQRANANLTQADINVLAAAARSSYALNKELRRSPTPPWPPADIVRIVRALDAAIAKGSVDRDVTVYRYVGHEVAKTISGLAVGDTYEDPGYTSASLKPFIRGPLGDEMRMSLHLPKGFCGIHPMPQPAADLGLSNNPVGSWGHALLEMELLLPRDLAFTIQKKNAKNQELCRVQVIVRQKDRHQIDQTRGATLPDSI